MLFQNVRRTGVLFISVALCVPVLALQNSNTQDNQNSNTDWTFLVLAQFWPSTSCYIYFGEEKCDRVPSNINGWTIHGLWPSGPGSSWPKYCDNSLQFDYEKIKDLSPLLDTRWHYFNSAKKKTYLWEHEWEKHGTCGISLPEISNQYKYFQKTFELHKKVDVKSALDKHDITPSSEPYKPADFFNSIVAEFRVKPNIVCSKSDGKFYIQEIFICLSKTFHLQDCASSSYYRGCPAAKSKGVLYLPLHSASSRMANDTGNVHNSTSEINFTLLGFVLVLTTTCVYCLL